MAKESTSKTTATKTTGKGFAAATQFPARAARTSKAAEKAAAGAAAPTDTPRFRNRKSKDTLTVLADQTKANKGDAKIRSAAAKHAEPSLAKKVASTQVKVAKKPAAKAAKKPAPKPASKLNADLLAHRTVKNIKQLCAVFDEFPKAVKFSTSPKLPDTLWLLNVRGKPIAEVMLAK